MTARYEADCQGWAYEPCTQKAAFRIRDQLYTGHFEERLMCFLHAHKMIDGWAYEVVPPNYRVLELLDR